MAQAKACPTYKPHVQQLISTQKDVRNTLKIADAVRGMTTADIQVLVGVLLQEKTTRKQGLYFHQKLYVRYRGTLRNYFSNFLIGYVLYATKEYVLIVGESGKTVFKLINEKDSPSYYTVDQFRPMREEMRVKKMYIDPQIDIDNASLFARRGGISPLDIVDESSITNRRVSKAKRYAANGDELIPDDMITMVRRAERGKVADRLFGSRSSKPAPKGVIQINFGA